MKPHLVTKALLAAGALSVAASPIAVSTASAQNYGDSYQDTGPPSDYDNGPPSDYDDAGPPPPPPGYETPADVAQQREQDQRYARYAEDWARDNCVKSGGNVAAGAVIGGIFGALVGSAVGGAGHRGGGAAVGALVGGTSGAAIAANSRGSTSPGCPPGYVVREGSPAFYYEAYNGPYYYAAPEWYHPWVWYDGAWIYRPYPYHEWYYRHYRDRDDYRRDRDDYGRDRDWDHDRR